VERSRVWRSTDVLRCARDRKLIRFRSTRIEIGRAVERFDGDPPPSNLRQPRQRPAEAQFVASDSRRMRKRGMAADLDALARDRTERGERGRNIGSAEAAETARRPWSAGRGANADARAYAADTRTNACAGCPAADPCADASARAANAGTRTSASRAAADARARTSVSPADTASDSTTDPAATDAAPRACACSTSTCARSGTCATGARTGAAARSRATGASAAAGIESQRSRRRQRGQSERQHADTDKAIYSAIKRTHGNLHCFIGPALAAPWPNFCGVKPRLSPSFRMRRRRVCVI
jgi:hypothetical protein